MIGIISKMFEDSQLYINKVVQTRMDILMRYTDENDKGEWVVAWSGGKDSTVVLGLVTEVIKALPPEQRKRKVHVIMSDTRVENPILATYMHDQVKKFNAYAERETADARRNRLSSGRRILFCINAR